ncbi:MAG: hypothetical protein NC548_61805 [Lachnospiraceae bacterium]|nr:hypothetical protein [Lachnospiraceae bacterium]
MNDTKFSVNSAYNGTTITCSKHRWDNHIYDHYTIMRNNVDAVNDKKTDWIYPAICGKVLTTCITMPASNPSQSNNYFYNPKQTVSNTKDKTNIDKSFTTNYCITYNPHRHSNNQKEILGGKIMTLNNKLEKKLNLIAALQDNWNGNNAKAFNESLITKVKNIIIFLDIQPEIFPTPCDSLQLEYDKQDGSHLEIEISESENAEVFLIDNNGNECLSKITANTEEINKAVNNFYG